jgi:hypothetical protein
LPNTCRTAFLKSLRSVNHEQHSRLDIEPAVDEVCHQRADDGRVLGRPIPQAERELVSCGRDPERDDVRAAVQLDPVEHHHRQPQIGERPVHQIPQLISGPLHKRARYRRLRRRPGVCRVRLS